MSETPDEAARLRAIAEREQQAAAASWIVEGRTIYALHHNGDYRKGKPVEVNRFYAQIQDMTRQGAQEGEAEATAQFIAHAREDVPYLLSLVARQAQEIESLRQLISKPAIADRLQQIADLRADYERQAQEIQELRTARDTFYMGYRIKSDAQSKAALVRAESAESSRDALREALKKARGYVVERMQLANPYDGPAKPGFVDYDLQMIDRALAETPTEKTL